MKTMNVCKFYYFKLLDMPRGGVFRLYKEFYIRSSVTKIKILAMSLSLVRDSF